VKQKVGEINIKREKTSRTKKNLVYRKLRRDHQGEGGLHENLITASDHVRWGGGALVIPVTPSKKNTTNLQLIHTKDNTYQYE